MTVQEAAKLIGCSPSRVTTLARQGVLKATREKAPWGKAFCFNIQRRSAVAYRNKKQPCGFPRGAKRNGERGPQV